jgi:branched-chain amino acid transport system substrate-binding protein
MTPPYQAAIAYTAGVVLSKAIERADSVDRNKVRNMLYSMDIQTITGRYGVDRTGMQIKHVPLLMQWQEGEQRVVWPEYLAVSAPILDAKP